MSAPDHPSSPSPEALARRHHRMQLGLGLDEGSRIERLLARPSFDSLENESHWPLVFIGAFAVAVVVAVGGYLLGAAGTPKPLVTPKFTVTTLPPSPPSRVLVTAVTPVSIPPIQVRLSVPTTTAALSYPTSIPTPKEPVRSPTPTVAATPGYSAPIPQPTPDYEARGRRIVELKQEAVALDDFVRQIRSNPYLSHDAEPGNHVYQAWKYTRGNLLIQDRFDSYMKRLDQRRDEVRREKWRLEGR